MNRIETLTTRIAGLRAALATDAELQTVRQYGSPDEFARAEELNASLLAAIAGYEAEMAELMAVQGDPLASAWLEYRKARQAYSEATRTRGGFSSEPKHPREVVRSAADRVAEAYTRVDEEVVRLHKVRSQPSAKGNTSGYEHACKMNFGGLPSGELRIVLDKAQGGKFIRVEDVNGNKVEEVGLWERPDNLFEVQLRIPVVKS